jgi:hypothetical protein
VLPLQQDREAGPWNNFADNLPRDVHELPLVVNMGTLTSFIIISQTIALGDRAFRINPVQTETTRLWYL